ncbi:F0F1 ATP synthase subunit gamma [Pelagibacteraceae bacterium]|jgi:F-type H+-transporting ATPase subunit gamma|nr:F0F1 ATP synthase subunit gamma [Pelagibacteraceae bacterium]GIR47569.1 MAG: ATP synthase gamma chain [Alphaproteobacteria bacterium]MDC3021956.1 F0F1 ATP synthase subunit gamma [Pelagibacteraceae bacterium]MDC3056206.1 F0F1 ATP synthase subunit gamma [Pelagibacteraceae bacterium]MDC3075077.1 F0F1 ATP synthase subunit gamma [Pelagibacteraceae bacterium]|tara:strand:- start:1442 stop:2332 length:891 start_codon:yes stop_codon:yes gene_type:complete
MPSLKDIKTQINSVGSTKKITSAMKMVAASKLRRSQEKAEAARPYSSRLEEMLSSLASSAASGEGIIKLLTGTGNDQNYIVVPVSADRGLCGGFNSSINRETFKLVKSLEGNGKKVQLMPVGKKSRDFFNRVMKDQIIESFVDLNVSSTGYESALNISNKLQELYFEGKFDKCILVFNKFKSAISQEVTQQQLIPLDVSNSEKEEEKENSSNAIYDYEPDEETILKDLLPKNVSIQIFKVLLESDAGEQGARMAAMDNATRNAGEMIDSLTLKYNRTRQAFITKELIEIISGAESI